MTQGPAVGVGAVVMHGDAVLLIRRGQPPRAGTWSLPGGKQKLGETVIAAARRELAEETGLSDLEWLGIADVVDLMDRDETGGLRFHYTVVDFAAVWRSGRIRAGDDAVDAAWVTIEEFADYGVTPLVRQVIDKAWALRRTALGL